MRDFRKRANPALLAPRSERAAQRFDARMTRHRWAADRLWEAIVGDSDDAWREGLDVLAATPLDFGVDRAPFARELQRIANNARRSKAPAASTRAATYGELLVTCAGGHTKGPR
jgi:hypothetical protein